MKETVNALSELNECTEVGETCNSTGNNVTYCKTGLSVSPRIFVRELLGQSNLGAVDALDESGNGIAGLEDLLRAFDTAPAHFRDVKQTVSAA